MHDQRDKVQRRLGKSNLSLKRLILPVLKAKVQEDGSICEAMTDMIDVSVRYRLHHWSHWVLSDRSNGRHVSWLAFVSLIPEVVAQSLQAFTLFRLEYLPEMFSSDVSQE